MVHSYEDRALPQNPRRRKPEAEAAAPQAESGAADAAPWVLVDASAVAADRALPYILSSYRPEGCTSVLRALFTLHNQSLNIYTHLLGLPYVASFVIAPPPSSAAAGPFVAALRTHAAVALLVGAASVAYHAGEAAPRRQLLLDAEDGGLDLCVPTGGALERRLDFRSRLPLYSAVMTARVFAQYPGCTGVLFRT